MSDCNIFFLTRVLLLLVCHSYERNYKPLVDNMIKKDLALKGNLDNVELLIFASNQLPPNCQRKNAYQSSTHDLNNLFGM